ncbi:predicted protein [Postia placenta Mad-698-R]|uniref:Uncharacterized protein n=1 Tax=Postia placenta MAD-698-R-SB12 TaxID=670580 RepID=A0A1X6MLF8_9APHY|nr:hypothetical protein POSPLADRAFT_1157708 [Postia placenta MAD-698-R-SB12]EED78627.1 predicted protein [Postia placenta Mad-698-R]OSX57244.1 hypothetical protein POSPLADRAFT_1157708 [Postia placenta MAD-698-R-SB12]
MHPPSPHRAIHHVGHAGDVSESDVKRRSHACRARAQKAYTELLPAIDAPPLTVLLASDGGRVKKVAKRGGGGGRGHDRGRRKGGRVRAERACACKGGRRGRSAQLLEGVKRSGVAPVIRVRTPDGAHSVIKGHLKSPIHDIDSALLETLAACGDVKHCTVHRTPPARIGQSARPHFLSVATASSAILPQPHRSPTTPGPAARTRAPTPSIPPAPAPASTNCQLHTLALQRRPTYLQHMKRQTHGQEMTTLHPSPALFISFPLPPFPHCEPTHGRSLPRVTAPSPAAYLTQPLAYPPATPAPELRASPPGRSPGLRARRRDAFHHRTGPDVHPCTENTPMAGRARTPMSASASCPAFHMRGRSSAWQPTRGAAREPASLPGSLACAERDSYALCMSHRLPCGGRADEPALTLYDRGRPLPRGPARLRIRARASETAHSYRYRDGGSRDADGQRHLVRRDGVFKRREFADGKTRALCTRDADSTPWQPTREAGAAPGRKYLMPGATFARCKLASSPLSSTIPARRLHQEDTQDILCDRESRKRASKTAQRLSAARVGWRRGREAISHLGRAGVTFGGGAKAAGVLHAVGTGTPSDMVRRCSVSLESRTETRTWCGNIGLDGAARNLTFEAIEADSCSMTDDDGARHTDEQQQNYYISIIHACGNSRRFFRPVQSAIGRNGEGFYRFRVNGSPAPARPDTHNVRRLNLAVAQYSCPLAPGPQHALRLPLPDAVASSAVKGTQGTRYASSRRRRPRHLPPRRVSLDGLAQCHRMVRHPSFLVSASTVCRRTAWHCALFFPSSAHPSDMPPLPFSRRAHVSLLHRHHRRRLSYTTANMRRTWQHGSDLHGCPARGLRCPPWSELEAGRPVDGTLQRSESELRSVVLPGKDSRGDPEDDIVSASCVDGQEAAHGVRGTAGQRDLSRARAEEQSRVITRARPDARKIPHPLWRETASIPPIRRAGRTQTSRAVPAPWHHGRISAGQGGASTAGGTLIHCLRRMAQAAGSLVVAFCGTCNVHTNAGRRQFNVRARSGDVFLRARLSRVTGRPSSRLHEKRYAIHVTEKGARAASSCTREHRIRLRTRWPRPQRGHKSE